MAQTKKDAGNAPATTKQTNTKTANEMREWYEKNKSRLERFDNANDAIKALRDIQKSKSYRTISNYNKEDIKEYLRNISSQEIALRNISRFLFYRSQIYYRLCKYYANQADLSIRNIIPPYSLTEDNNKDDVLKAYEETLVLMNESNFQYEFFKAYVTCLREDVFYGCCYRTEGEGIFFLPLDPDYMKIAGVYPSGDFAPAMNMTYFNRNKELLDLWGSPFKEMKAESDRTGEKWIVFPPEYGVCVKFRSEDYDTIVPPLAPMFIDLVSLLDLADIQAVGDEANIYKMVWLEMKTLGQDVDDWAVDPDILLKFYDRMIEEALPDYISSAIVPGELHEINFPDDAASDVTKVEKATKEILNTAGGAQILNLNSASNSTAFKYGVMMDSEFALSSLIPQTQAIINRLLKSWLSNPCFIKLFEVSIYQKDDFRKSILESCQNGLPNKILLNAINGISELDTLSMNFLEEDVLNLSEKLKPFSTSYTQSNKGGGQEKDDSDLTDDAIRKRDQK